ncbi:MAG TPA: 3-deoxy-D-manno-octulosonic acid transferase, partial [Dissulfurispiraceae bacterium]|nr:3-deoxy-D-manno-octulosonic acid transferase [Dissulfurispiraceae bacterium]
MYWFYSLLYAVVLIVLSPFEFFRRPPGARMRWLKERLGRYETLPLAGSPDRETLWLHAVSVGETIAAVPLVRKIASRHRSLRIVVSTVTDTGQQVARERLGDDAHVVYVPFDLPWTVRRALDRLKPSLLIIMETELWPNLIMTARSRGVPVLVVNGRISERSYSGYRRIAFFLLPVLRAVDLFCMQNEVYAERVRVLGAPAGKVKVLGSLKFDTRPLKPVPPWTGILEGPVIVAGSTHRSEEDLILGAYVELKRDIPDLNLILVPRHPERFGEVEDVTSRRGLNYLKRSELDATSAPAPGSRRSGVVVILDAMGELSAVYGACDVAVMGGSFIPRGGQNPLEPAYWAKPVVCGPHMENFAFIREFYQSGGAVEVDARSLPGRLLELLRSPERRTA